MIDVGVEDSHEQDTINYWELGDQQRSKRDKDKIMEDKGLNKSQKKLINNHIFLPDVLLICLCEV